MKIVKYFNFTASTNKARLHISGKEYKVTSYSLVVSFKFLTIILDGRFENDKVKLGLF